MRYLSILLVAITLAGLAGCSKMGIGGHSRDYITKGNQVASLTVPRGVPPINQQAYYAVPPIQSPVHANYSASHLLTPPTLKQKTGANKS